MSKAANTTRLAIVQIDSEPSTIAIEIVFDGSEPLTILDNDQAGHVLNDDTRQLVRQLINHVRNNYGNSN